MKVKYYTFWSVNAALDQVRLGQDLREFKKAGLDGVVFHPRFYPGIPPYLSDEYLSIVSDVILDAKSLGLSFWIYDENGWPSGTVSGEMLKRYPQQAQQWAGLVDFRPEKCLVEFVHEGKTWYLAHRLGRGVNYLDPRTAEAFLELTHDRYRKGLATEAFDHVETIFCDEPECGLGHAFDMLPPQGAIPWTTNLPELFKKRYGRDLLPLIPQLFFRVDSYREVRIQFWELMADLFRDAFVRPIDDWCKKYGKRFTGHVKGEEHPFFQVPIIGCNHRALSAMGMPGIDALERFPLNDFFPRQAASVSAQFSDGRTMVEALGGSGWGLRPEDMERYLLWLGKNGLTDFVFHLSQYRLNSSAIHDWPPSQPLHVNWKDAYPVVLGNVRKKLETNSSSPTPVETLVVVPYRSVMAEYEPGDFLKMNIHNGATSFDSPATRVNKEFLSLVEKINANHIPHHYVDEATFEESVIENGALKVGNCLYRKIVLSADAVLGAIGKELLGKMGGAVEILSSPVPFARVKGEKRISLPVKWTVFQHDLNHLVLDHSLLAGETYSAVFAAEGDLSGVRICFADDVDGVKLNGRDMESISTGNGTIVDVQGEFLRDENQIQFSVKEKNPFLWIEGKFLVRSGSSYIPAANKTIRTEGKWTLVPRIDKGAIPTEFVSGGYPFNRTPLVLSGEFESLGGGQTTLELVGSTADTIRISIDGKDYGFAYGPDWRIFIGSPLDKGTHTIHMEAIPNTYNFYGPHHHFNGDIPVVSPDQYEGKKNFLEKDGDPECTLVPAWHFLPVKLPDFFMV